MRYLLDTGILLRLTNRNAANHQQIRDAVRLLKSQGHAVLISLQNVSEFWNVCTRPAEARDGLRLSPDEAKRRLRTLERIATVLADSPDTYPVWKELITRLQVRGVQVHDTKLAALMKVHGVTELLTLNPRDFHRFDSLHPLTPEQVLASRPATP